MEDKWESLYNLLALNSYPSGYKKSKRQNLRRYALKFSLKDGDLFYKGRRVIKTKEEARMFFQELHSSPIGGHTGIGKTRAAICARFYWHGMTVDIENWVLECDICQKVGKPLTAVQTFQCIETLCEKTGPLDPLAQTAMDVDHDHKPVGHDHKAVDHDHKAVGHVHKPVGHDHKAVGHVHKPVSHDHKPVDHDHKPVDHYHDPGCHDHKPGYHDHKAVGHDHKAVDHDHKAVGHDHKAVDHDHKAVGHDHKAVGHDHKAVDHDHKPVDHVVSPAVNRIYMDYNATTPVDPEVVSVVTEALNEAWGNPSSMYLPGLKAKDIINQSRESVARMVGGNATDIIFTSGGTEANNMVFHSVIEHFWKSSMSAECVHVENNHFNGKSFLPHIITSNVEHDSVKLVAEHLVKMGKADVTFLPVSKLTGQVEVEDVIAALRPSTCLVSVMLANNETGVIMPIREICQRVKTAKRSSSSPKILLHTDAAQAIGKICVDAQGLGVDYLTIVGHKFYAPRIGALFVKGPGTMTPLYPLLFGGGQERNFRPGTENTAMIAGLGKAAELVTANLVKDESHLLDIRLYLEQRLLAVFGKKRLHFNSHFHGTDTLPNTCNVSILGQGLYGRRVLSTCRRLLASVGAACHSDHGDQPSHILLNCGIPYHIAVNALRISLGRGTSQEDVDIVVEDLRDTVEHLEQMSLFSLEHP